MNEMYPPGYGGGGGAYVQDVCRLLAAKGHTIGVICAESAPGEPYTIRTTYDREIEVFRVNLPYIVDHDPEGWSMGLRKWRSHQRRLRSVIGDLVQNWSPDLVQCHLARPFGEEFLFDLRERRVPMVWMFHDAWHICVRLQLLRSPRSEVCDGPNFFKCVECIYSHFDGSHANAIAKLPWRLLRLGLLPAYRVKRRLASRSTATAAFGYSRYMAAVHARNLPVPVSYVPMGIDVGGLGIDRPSRPRRPFRFGFMAGFQPHKGIWHVLDAAASLKRKGLDFELHVWGPLQENGPPEIAARSLEDRVKLRGVFSSPERWSVYAEIDMAIMATTWPEPYGRIVGEAAASGIPTIAPATGGLSEQFENDRSGLLYRFRDAAHLEQQMERILSDSDLYPRLVANLPAVLDTRDAISSLEQFYFETLENAKR